MKSLTTAALLLVLATPLPAMDWPHVRGPAMDGTAAGTGLFVEGAPGLEIAWKIPLGSGYSGIAAAGGTAVTLFTSGDEDWVAAFGLADGKELWRRSLGPKNAAHDGSSDGPISSPVIGGDTVYALAPSGALLALALGSGEVRWQRILVQDFGAPLPDFGFGTSPLIEGGILVVQAGGSEGRSLVALDAKTGETRWTTREDAVGYQSPATLTLAGRRQIVAVAGATVGGFDPASGEALWTYSLPEGEDAGSANPAPAGGDRFLVFVNGDAVVFEVSKTEGAFEAKELYRSRALGQSYVPPVLHEGTLYGFRGNILSAMDAASGEQKWRSREPGGDGLLLVDGHLAIFAAKGNLVIAEATPEGYRELTRRQVFAGSGLTWPSFADGRILLRNLEEMAAVALTPGNALAVAAATAPAVGRDHAFGRWLTRAESSDDPAAMVRELLASHETLPIVEGEYIHFLFDGEAQDVALSGTVVRDGGAETMERLPGTNLFYRTLRLEPGSRWEYGFHVDFERRIPDPKNPRKIPSLGGWGMLSEVFSDGYAVASHFEEPETLGAPLERFVLKSEALDGDKEIRVWLPPGYAADEETRYPLLIVNNSQEWLEAGKLGNTLDNLVGTALPPMVVALVPKADAWWLEGGGSGTEAYARMLAKELVPELRKRYRLRAESASTALLGSRYFGLTSAFTALEYPDVFGKVALQSPNLSLGSLDDVEDKIRARQGAGLWIYLDWDRYGERNVDRDLDATADAEAFAALLASQRYTWTGGEVLDSSGWGAWRNRTDRILKALFPPSS